MKKQLLVLGLLSLSMPGWSAEKYPTPYILQDQIAYQAEKPAKKVLFATDRYELLIFAFQKGQGLKTHTVPFRAHIQILSGTARLWLDGKAIDLQAGEAYDLPASLPHSLEALESDFKMLLLKQPGKL
jgi:quercetin dioxygenase-like cupin family protein